MAVVTERYSAFLMAVNQTRISASDHIGGFLCQTAGTITVTVPDLPGTSEITIIGPFPVSAGVYYPMPFYVGPRGCTITTAGGASGTMGV